MRITIEQSRGDTGMVRIDGRSFCYCVGHNALSEDISYNVVLKSELGDIIPVIVGAGMEITDQPGDGLQVGKIAGDDFVIDGRACLSTLINSIRDAIDSMEIVTLEVV